ncbi:PKD domain-containing protein [Luteolibacter arcticus]|uniref:PKD domain-containing protein n=1 Tax=Luteolibacter arcticus TaxID=1581411 RepID=A0ABT3GJR8_9BACT|nr:PKD domain-containing protein [Luteolibacter arcticus]MCW1923752.1 PKD domain-containing protein [Luteolibacter arcticus]
MRRLLSLVLPLVLLVGIALWWLGRDTPAPPSGRAVEATKTLPPVADPALEQWLNDHREVREIPTTDLQQAVTLATERKARMLQWIAADPAQALAQAVTPTQYEALPEPLKPWFERPFVALATLRVLPVCADGAPAEPMRILEMEGRSWDASVFGWRKRQLTKEGTPLAGITLDGVAAIAEHAFAPVAADEVAAHAALPLGNQDPTRDFSTGEVLGDRPVTALAAGKRFLFADSSSLDEANQKMAQLDESVSPTHGSNVVFALPSPAEGGGVDWEGAQGEVELQASAWSETPKSVFCIRVDFSDVPGEVVSQAALATVMNTAVADSLEEMSYGKTTVTATVSASTVRMPQTATFYAPSKNSELHTDAKNAYLAVAGASALNGYDIVVVHFPSIGMQGNGLTYAGLAGGGNQWLQGNHDSGVIIHEFGHNYGLGHASFWATTDGSVAGTGNTVEYGDQTDIMGGGPDPEGHFHIQGKQRLGWFSAANWQDATATGSGTRRIYRFDSDATTGELRGVRITKAAAPAQYYWVGYRPGISTQPAFQQGAYVIWQRPDETRSWLLDTTPGTPDGKNDAAVGLGRTFSDTTANVHVTPLAIGGAGADQWLDVNVQIGPFPGNTPPTATLTGSGSVEARSDVTFSATASDGNGDTLAYHWDFGDGSASTNTSAVNHRWLVGGSYTVTLTVSDMKGGTVVKTQAVTVSDPLMTWTAGTVSAGRTVNRNAYLNGRFIATGNQYAYGSFDGLTWKEQYMALNFRSGGIAYGNGRYVIAGSDYISGQWRAVAFHSTDGVQWTQATLASLPELRDVAWSGSAFVAVGVDGTILRSTDGGQTWSTITAPGIQTLQSIAYGGGVFVAVGGTKVYTSPDGIAWTDRSAGHSLASWHSFDSVEYAAGKFIAGGWYSGLHVSLNGGVTWSETPIRGDHDYEVENIAAGNGSVVASAIDKADGTTALLVSIDGLSWEESSYTGFPFTPALAFGSGRYSTVNNTGGGSSRSNSFYPSNGAPSASITAPATANARASVTLSATTSDPNGDPLIIAWDFKNGKPLVTGPSVIHVYPTGGAFSVDLIATDTRGGVTVTTHAITVTDPLDTWITRTSGTATRLNDIAYGGGKLVAVGDSSTYRISTDGINWTGGSVASNVYLYGLTHDGSNFIGVGMNYDFDAPVGWKGAIYTSPNGTTWTRRHLGGATLRDVAFGGGAYIAVGDSGAMWRSTNGMTWSPVPSGVAVNVNSVAYGSGGFVAVGAANNGSNGTVLTSPDGTTWTNTSAAAGLDSWHGFYEVDYCNDRFLASGWFAKIRHSTNGGASFATTQTGTRQIAGFAYGNGLYFAAGIDMDNLEADINLISTDGVNWNPLTTANEELRQAAVFFNNTFITVGDFGTIRQSAVFTAPPASGYSAWLALHFAGSPPLSGSDDDFDGDGVANLIEYATGTDPKDSGARVAFTHTVQGGQLILTIPRDPAATDVEITGERSTLLNGWSDTGVTVLEDTALQFRAAIPIDGSKAFLRAKFSVN